MIVRRFVTIYAVSGGYILEQDTGPGTWGWNRSTTGIYQITWPEPMTWNMATFVNAIIHPRTTAIYQPESAAVGDLSQTGCTVRRWNAYNTNQDGIFTLELIGEPQ